MRRAVVAAALAGITSATGIASAEELPPGSLGVIIGVIAGTGADATPLGIGYALGGQAAWQPMSTESRLGWSVKSSVVFGTMYSASAARIDNELLTLQMDIMVGLRVRPGASPSRYLSARVGGALFRANQVIPPNMQRAFAGAVASIGLDQYISGWLFNADVRYGLIGQGPSELGLVLGVAKTGP
jgi:hypothetical protein